MRKLFLTYVIFCTLILLSNTIVYAGGTSKTSQSKIVALYSKKIMTGGVIVAANQSKNDTAISLRRTKAFSCTVLSLFFIHSSICVLCKPPIIWNATSEE